MRPRVTVFFVILLSFGFCAARAPHTDLGAWFYDATGLDESSIDGVTMKSPDFLPGKSRNSMQCGGRGVPIGNGIWQLVQYDRVHRIGFAMATTDQCSVSLFKASPPDASVPDANLSNLSTGRGIRIGSTYESVLAAYGGKAVKHGRHFLTVYASGVETITVVFDGDRVSAITVTIDESGLY